MSRRGDPRVRAELIREAARLMYEEGVRQYFTAKRLAAKRLFSRRGARELRFRPHDLPSNGEIQAALLELASLHEGPDRPARLAAMRRVALVAMLELDEFSPRLIGSVATGHARTGSDIDIQLFCDDQDGPERFLQARGWPYERQDVLIRRPGLGLVSYQHLLVDADWPIELSIYDRGELRRRPRSSTDGKPMLRLTAAALASLIAREHPEEEEEEDVSL